MLNSLSVMTQNIVLMRAVVDTDWWLAGHHLLLLGIVRSIGIQK